MDIQKSVHEADPITQLRGNHISDTGGRPDTYRHLVDADTQDRIRRELGLFFKAAGYT